MAAQEHPAPQAQSLVTLRYLGTAGWKISNGAVTVLVDPYVARINGPPPPSGAGSPITGDTRPKVGWDDIATSDTTPVDSRIPRADYVLVTHTHYDHVLDVPQIALKKHATVIGTESTQT
jgi:L-ascorbate metabolism protein UlaG (beta-lactamase superfamily)